MQFYTHWIKTHKNKDRLTTNRVTAIGAKHVKPENITVKGKWHTGLLIHLFVSESAEIIKSKSWFWTKSD